jgi:hypothetical protein
VIHTISEVYGEDLPITNSSLDCFAYARNDDSEITYYNTQLQNEAALQPDKALRQ